MVKTISTMGFQGSRCYNLNAASIKARQNTLLSGQCSLAHTVTQKNTSPQASSHRWPRYLLGSALLFGLIFLVESWIGWHSLLSPWRTVAPEYLFVAIILIFFSYSLRALRVYDYFLGEMRGRFRACLRLSLQHNLLNNLLPMRAGELSFPLLMSRDFAVNPLRSVPALLWFRFLDLHTLLALSLWVASETFVTKNIGQSTLLGIALIWMTLPWLAFKLNKRSQQWLSGHTGKAFTMLTKILQSLPQQPGLFWRCWLWTALNWSIKLAAFAWILTLFSELPLATAWVGAIMGDFTSVLPIHGVAGAGTYEAGVVAGLLPFGINAEHALQAAVNLHLFVLGCTLLSGLISLLLPRAHAAALSSTKTHE
jgi:glycosyltransferase 2 family protein